MMKLKYDKFIYNHKYNKYITTNIFFSISGPLLSYDIQGASVGRRRGQHYGTTK